MGLLETLEGLNLSDEQKQVILNDHTTEVGAKETEIQTLKAKDRRSDVDKEIDELAALLSDSPQPGLLKFVRRVYLSDDDGPGIVLLSDADLQLSGDAATGASTREEMSVAGAIRHLISLLPRNAEGNLSLSDQGIAADDTNRPDKDGDKSDEDKEAEEKARRERVSRLGIKLRKRPDEGGDA